MFLEFLILLNGAKSSGQTKTTEREREGGRERERE